VPRHTRTSTVDPMVLGAGGILLVVGVALILIFVLLPGDESTSSFVPPTSEPPSASTLATTLASTTSTQRLTTTTTARAIRTDPFDLALAMRHVEYLADVVGVRHAGSNGERTAAEYIAATLRESGYETTSQTFDLLGGLQSRNVIAQLAGEGDGIMLLGAHYDTKGGSPGANDNGTGTAALLAIAHELRDETLDATIRFVFFGAEEAIDSNPDNHHYGSRHYVRAMLPEEQRRLRGMISVDMIGFGPEFRVRTMGGGPQSLSDELLALGRAQGLPLTYLRDSGSSGWSDHEPFEVAGYPAAWIEWRDDPATHSPRDVPSHVDPAKVAIAGQLVLDFVRAQATD
jgi:hypothetical protein